MHNITYVWQYSPGKTRCPVTSTRSHPCFLLRGRSVRPLACCFAACLGGCLLPPDLRTPSLGPRPLPVSIAVAPLRRGPRPPPLVSFSMMASSDILSLPPSMTADSTCLALQTQRCAFKMVNAVFATTSQMLQGGPQNMCFSPRGATLPDCAEGALHVRSTQSIVSALNFNVSCYMRPSLPTHMRTQP